MSEERPGIPFEKAVAAVQAQFDPSARVAHNEILVDRLGHPRQFDVVIRGRFAGQEVLGVIECKDLKRKVGTPEIDAFVTKSQDVNANVRLFLSRRGFTKPALEKCTHYGIQPLSLLGHDTPRLRVLLGTRWEADRFSWSRAFIQPTYLNEPTQPVHIDPETLSINGRKVFSWFTNHLLAHFDDVEEVGWFGVRVDFSVHQLLQVAPGEEYLCGGIEFHAERIREMFERMVAVNGPGFYDWSKNTASFPPGVTISAEPVPMDFSRWTKVEQRSSAPVGFLTIRMVTHSVQFEHIEDAIELDVL